MKKGRVGFIWIRRRLSRASEPLSIKKGPAGSFEGRTRKSLGSPVGASFFRGGHQEGGGSPFLFWFPKKSQENPFSVGFSLGIPFLSPASNFGENSERSVGNEVRSKLSDGSFGRPTKVWRTSFCLRYAYCFNGSQPKRGGEVGSFSSRNPDQKPSPPPKKKKRKKRKNHDTARQKAAPPPKKKKRGRPTTHRAHQGV